jgi:hypothetical protein
LKKKSLDQKVSLVGLVRLVEKVLKDFQVMTVMKGIQILFVIHQMEFALLKDLLVHLVILDTLDIQDQLVCLAKLA